jgi:hypothetical protein
MIHDTHLKLSKTVYLTENCLNVRLKPSKKTKNSYKYAKICIHFSMTHVAHFTEAPLFY